jgi:hypothetical protein
MLHDGCREGPALDVVGAPQANLQLQAVLEFFVVPALERVRAGQL